MNEVHIKEHYSPIKTPKQLIIVILLSFLIPIALIVMLTHLVTGSSDLGKDNPGMSDEAIANRLKPVGEVVVVDASAPKIEKTGQQVVESVCAACHASGVLSAPKIGDKAAWGKLITKGQQNLTQEAIKGIRQMPARGGNPDLSDTEFARAVAYMANQAGAGWKEPEAAKPALSANASGTAAVAAVAPQAASSPAQPAKAGAGTGKTVYDSTCHVCHATGVAGAPKTGDKAAWAPRIKTGMDTLHNAALKGLNAMPPKGGNMALSDDDVKAAVDYMVNLAK